MEENRPDVVTQVLNKYAWFYKVPSGFVLVRRSVFGTYHMGGVKTEIKEKDVNVHLKVTTLADDKLDFFINKYSGSSEPQKQRLYTLMLEEKSARQQEASSNTTVERSLALRTATIETVIQKYPVNLTKYEQKYGIKMRVPFEDVIMVPTTELSLDTAVIEITDNEKKYDVTVDTDYKYIIEDPVLFIEKQETLRMAGKNILKEIGDLLDDLTRQHIKSIGIENYIGKVNSNILLENAIEVLNIRKDFGVQITRFFIKDINLPKTVAEANEQYAVAEKEAQTEAIKQEAAGKAKAAATNAEIQGIAQGQNMSEQDARNFVLDRERAQNQRFGSQPVPQPMPQSAPQPVPQPSIPEATLRELSLTDDEGYLSREASKFIAQLRGEHLEPGTVYHASDLNIKEAFSVASKFAQQNNNQTTVSYTEDQIQQLYSDGLCDDEGYLTRADSRSIAEQRGVQLAPGKVFHVNDLFQGEIDFLRQKNSTK